MSDPYKFLSRILSSEDMHELVTQQTLIGLAEGECKYLKNVKLTVFAEALERLEPYFSLMASIYPEFQLKLQWLADNYALYSSVRYSSRNRVSIFSYRKHGVYDFGYESPKEEPIWVQWCQRAGSTPTWVRSPGRWVFADAIIVQKGIKCLCTWNCDGNLVIKPNGELTGMQIRQLGEYVAEALSFEQCFDRALLAWGVPALKPVLPRFELTKLEVCAGKNGKLRWNLK